MSSEIILYIDKKLSYHTERLLDNPSCWEFC